MDVEPVVERALLQLVVEAAPIGAVADFRPHERPPRVLSAVLVARRDEDAARQGVESQRSGHPVERIAARRVLGEMRDAEACSACLGAQFGERLEADPRLDALMAVAFDHKDDRIEDDQADVLEALNRLRQRRHVGSRIKGPFLSALAHAFDEVHHGRVASGRQKARQERVLDAVLAAPEDDAGGFASRLTVRPLAAAGDGRGEGQRDGRLAIG